MCPSGSDISLYNVRDQPPSEHVTYTTWPKVAAQAPAIASLLQKVRGEKGEEEHAPFKYSS